MSELILAPLLAGLSTGLFCCLSCYPVLAPVFVAEERSPPAALRTWLEVLAGRLLGYLLFGAALGGLGERFAGPWPDRISNGVMLAMAALLIFYALGFWKPALSLCAAGTRRGRAAPALLGFLTGLNACPPFLMSAAYVFTLHSAAKGALYFLVFFGATSVYFFPLLFAGRLGRLPEFRRAARASALAVGILFWIYGILRL